MASGKSVSNKTKLISFSLHDINLASNKFHNKSQQYQKDKKFQLSDTKIWKVPMILFDYQNDILCIWRISYTVGWNVDSFLWNSREVSSAVFVLIYVIFLA